MFPLGSKRRPLVHWKKYATERATADQVRSWWSQHPEAWIGLALGEVSKVVRIDADGPGVGEFRALCHGTTAPEFSTPSGGRGWIFSIPQGVTVETETLWVGSGRHEELRLQSTGAYTALPPSPGYTWEAGDWRKLPPVPAFIVDGQMSRRAAKILAEEARKLNPTAVEPDRNTVEEAVKHLSTSRCDDYYGWIRVGIALHAASDDYLELWDAWSKQSDKYEPGCCERKWATFTRGGGCTVRSVLHWAKEDSGWRPPNKHEQLTDDGNATVLARACTGQAVFCRQWNDWIAWDGKRWRMDASYEVVELQKRLVRERFSRAVQSLRRVMLMDVPDDERNKRLKSMNKVLSWCLASQAERRISAAVKLARSVPQILVDSSAFNRSPWLFNCANGTYDVELGELRDHRPEDMLTQVCPTDYDADAECPRWEQFLLEVFSGDAQLVEWLRRMLGYCVTGSVCEHVLPIFHGTGRNGKSTLVNTVMAVLGPDYAGITPSGFLALQKGEQHPERLLCLYGRRFVADMETGDGMKLNEELIKRLTGGDKIRARDLYQKSFDFDPTHKLVLATNYEPNVKGSDDAIWGRLRKIPFQVSFLGKEDRALAQKLLAESRGILRWMVDGCLAWRDEGLGAPASILEATDEYKLEQDTVAVFFRERCEKLPSGTVKRADAYSAYRAWCYSGGFVAVSSKAFAIALSRFGVTEDGRTLTGMRVG